MKSIHTASAQATAGVQAVAVSRRAYSAPQLTTFGSVSALTAGGSGANAEFNMMTAMMRRA